MDIDEIQDIQTRENRIQRTRRPSYFVRKYLAELLAIVAVGILFAEAFSDYQHNYRKDLHREMVWVMK